MRVAGFVCAVLLLIASFLAGDNASGQAIPVVPPSMGGNNANPVIDQSAASGAPRLTAAFIPPGPGQPGRVDLQIAGSGFAAGQKVSITGPVLDTSGRVIGDEVADSVAINFRNSTRSDASVTLKAALSPAATYTVHLFDKSDSELSSVSLDLEYVVGYRTSSNLGLETPASTAGDSWLGALHKKHEADKIERQTAANERLIAAKMKAAEVQRQMYLFDHPEVSPQGRNRFSTSGQPSDVVPSINPYCMADSTAESTYIRVRRSVVDPKEASDSYGRRLGRRFIVFEVTVENNNPNLQYMLHDVSVDLSRLHNVAPGTYRWAFSSQDLIMLRGVPEKGSDYDPRNLAFHIARGTGAVAGGVTGLTAEGIQDLYGGVTAAFNGPLLSSFIDILPDHTATQLNRLSDSAFTANTVVPKQSAKTFAIFVPEGVFMTHSEQNAYWKEPTTVFDDPGLDFRQADVCVDGAFITVVPALTLTAATYDNPDTVKAGADAPITISGSSLSAGDTIVDAFNTQFSVSSADSSGATAHATLKFPADWNFSVTPQVALESKGTGYKTPPLPLAQLPQLAG